MKEKGTKKKHPILTVVLIILTCFNIVGLFGESTEEADDATTEDTLESEEIVVSEDPKISEPEIDETTVCSSQTTEDNADDVKYPKEYNDKGELIVYWLDSGSVWHESTKCATVKNADPSKLHSGSPKEAFSRGKERACKTCSADSTVVLPEITDAPDTTHTPETTIEPEITTVPEETISPPETTNTPETTIIPETTDELDSDRTIYWIDAGYVWHYNMDCWTLGSTDPSIIHTGVPLEAYTAGMLRGCLVCAGDALYTPSEDIFIVSYPKTARRNETVSVTIQALPNTKYNIVVNYKTGPSKSKDLDEKTSDEKGIVTWTWTVGARSAEGTFEIIVKDADGKSVKVEWTIIVD
jgi:hypothetical protein